MVELRLWTMLYSLNSDCGLSFIPSGVPQVHVTHLAAGYGRDSEPYTVHRVPRTAYQGGKLRWPQSTTQQL